MDSNETEASLLGFLPRKFIRADRVDEYLLNLIRGAGHTKRYPRPYYLGHDGQRAITRTDWIRPCTCLPLKHGGPEPLVRGQCGGAILSGKEMPKIPSNVVLEKEES
jgi:hypothetical protein